MNDPLWKRALNATIDGATNTVEFARESLAVINALGHLVSYYRDNQNVQSPNQYSPLNYECQGAVKELLANTERQKITKNLTKMEIFHAVRIQYRNEFGQLHNIEVEDMFDALAYQTQSELAFKLGKAASKYLGS